MSDLHHAKRVAMRLALAKQETSFGSHLTRCRFCLPPAGLACLNDGRISLSWAWLNRCRYKTLSH